MTDSHDVAAAMSTSTLENKLKELKEKSNKHSQVLTAKLASSQSGQNLLHIGTSLSTLPPDLHSLLTQLHPVLSAAESTEKQYVQQLQSLVQCGNEIRVEQRRVHHAMYCADLYEDLVAAEAVVKKDAALRRAGAGSGSGSGFTQGNNEESITDATPGRLDHVSSLEHCAHTTLFLVRNLQSSTQKTAALTSAKALGHGSTTNNSLPTLRNALEEDLELAQFLMKLSPRIRRLESDTIISLSHQMEQTLLALQRRRENSDEVDENDQSNGEAREELVLLMLGNCMRGLALLGRGKEVENIFARVAIMPIIRSRISMGRLDEGGARGECAGLPSLLKEITDSVSSSFGPLLRLSELMFDVGPQMEVDLITAGVWAPIVTALMADAGIRMAIFSPGIASILQANYLALDNFLSTLAKSLLDSTSSDSVNHNVPKSERMYFRPDVTTQTINGAQDRIYTHAKTAEFSKKWNLPIYYQLRFGECCTRLNKALVNAKTGGWVANVFTGKAEKAEELKNTVGFELPFFLELYDILLGLWQSDVILRPLANRFLRGAVQLTGRSLAFIKDGMEGKLLFGADDEGEARPGEGGNNPNTMNLPTRSPYCWGESVQDVAAVAWELAILETMLAHDYISIVVASLSDADSTAAESAELRRLITEVLQDASRQIRPLIHMAWNDVIVNILTKRCSGPLAAVKGVAATYRMTNRPPPTQASPFVATILRPMSEFCAEFENRTPAHLGDEWKLAIIGQVTERYAAAIEELITTVQRTEVALHRRTRRAASGGISDGDKVKLQLYLDFQEFCNHITNLQVDPSSVPALEKLRDLTAEGGQLQKR